MDAAHHKINNHHASPKAHYLDNDHHRTTAAATHANFDDDAHHQHLNGDHVNDHKNNNNNHLNNQHQNQFHSQNEHLPPQHHANERKTFSGQSTFPSFGSRGSSSTSSLTKLLDGDDSEDGDNVNVVVRLRPPPAKDAEEADIKFPGDGQVLIDKNEKLSGNKPRHFTFNVAFEGSATQEDVFEHSGIKRLIEMALEGFSCTIFAYGQTGSGKTHTLSGPPLTFGKNHRAIHPNPKLDGIMQRSFAYLFKLIAEKYSHIISVIQASFLEIYNEQVIDLLNPTQRKYLTERWNKAKGFYVENLFLVECAELDDILAVMEEGLRNRQVSANNMNENSSRSHAILTLHITTDASDPEDKGASVRKYGRLLFVDLAGSEKVTEKSTSQGSMNETNKINRSLLTLGKCISGLGDLKKKKAHIPYRDSKLTKLLKDSIGGNGVTLMVACISPMKANLSESLNTLYYATQTKKIKNKPHIVIDPREHLILCLKKENKLLKSEVQYLKEQLHFPKITRSASAPHPAKNLMILEKLKSNLHSGHFPNDLQVQEVYDVLKNFTAQTEELREANTDLLGTKEFLLREQEIVSRENERLIKRLEMLEKNTSLSPGHSSLSNGSLSTLSDFDIGVHGTSPTMTNRLPPHLAHPSKPPHRLPESISKDLHKMRIGENVNVFSKPWSNARAKSRRNSWDMGSNSTSKQKKSHTAGSSQKKVAHLTGAANTVRRSESDQHLRKSVEAQQQHPSKDKSRSTSTNSLPKLLGYDSPKKKANPAVGPIKY